MGWRSRRLTQGETALALISLLRRNYFLGIGPPRKGRRLGLALLQIRGFCACSAFQHAFSERSSMAAVSAVSIPGKRFPKSQQCIKFSVPRLTTVPDESVTA